ncbi:hypothetical protein EVJ58_g5597 [Rhodofomes roseus]|uniref:Uncharacterized protein n=1 Tax=Rhodofomes roseus TaxID=34475 RepID=A0A4Y9YDS7_9APHY|nr:hypothetical protein EVJ58_g5597 [Rhodofomes roseus]
MPEEAVGAVNLARLTGTLTILPSALYMCCQLSSKDLLRGVTLSDGTIEKLNDGDVERCFDAREEVMRQNINSMLRLWQPDTARACSTPTFCKHALEVQAEAVRLVESGTFRGYDLFSTFVDPLKEAPQLCASCDEMIRGRANTTMRKHWALLPAMLNLKIPGWVGSEGEGNRTVSGDDVLEKGEHEPQHAVDVPPEHDSDDTGEDATEEDTIDGEDDDSDEGTVNLEDAEGTEATLDVNDDSDDETGEYATPRRYVTNGDEDETGYIGSDDFLFGAFYPTA